MNNKRVNKQFLLTDKPKNITSFGVVHQIRKIAGIKKVGHGGTLDPNATGLLIVAVGRDSTKHLNDLINKTDKTYIAEIVLGESRDTDDIEGAVVSKTKVDKPPTKKDILNILPEFTGEIMQMPPNYSAIKLKGKKAYELARSGKSVNLKLRKVVIHSIKLVNYKYPELHIEAKVGSGTYIRALARDIGKKLETGAYLKNLRRTKIGKFDVNEAVELDKITSDNWQGLTVS